MASGRRDYSLAVTPQRVLLGSYQNPWADTAFTDVDPGVTQNMISYTVPSGYRLIILDCIVSASVPGYHWCVIYLNAGEARTVNFETAYNFPESDSGNIVFDEGDELLITVLNNGRQTGRFNVSATGFLDPKT